MWCSLYLGPFLQDRFWDMGYRSSVFCTSWKIIQNCLSGGLRWSTVLLEIHKGVWFLCFPWRIGKWDRRSAGDEERACKCLVSSWSQIKWICQGAWFWSFSPFNLEAEMRKRKKKKPEGRGKEGVAEVRGVRQSWVLAGHPGHGAPGWIGWKQYLGGAGWGAKSRNENLVDLKSL